MSQRSRDAKDAVIKLSGELVRATPTVKLLGVTIDRLLLHFGEHCANLKREARPGTAQLRKLTSHSWGLREARTPPAHGGQWLRPRRHRVCGARVAPQGVPLPPGAGGPGAARSGSHRDRIPDINADPRYHGGGGHVSRGLGVALSVAASSAEPVEPDGCRIAPTVNLT